MKTFFITGIQGFIGTNLANYLFEKGYKVRGIDNLTNPSNQKLNHNIEFLKADIRHINEYIQFMKGSDYILHLAAMSRIESSPEKDLFALEQNVYGTQRVLEAAIANKVKRIVYTGSSTYYGSSSIPNRIGDEPDFLNSYGLSKYLGEEVIRNYSRNKIEFNILRLFNVFGPGQPKSGNYALVFGIFLDQKNRNLPLTIHGDGEQTRDFIHVSDVSNAFLKASIKNVSGEIFNVGSGKNISVIQLAKLISNNFKFEQKRANDAMHTLADIKKTKDLLDWDLKLNPLKEIERMIKI